MTPTDILKDEHRRIVAMLSVLDAMCARLRAGASVDLDHLGKVLEFLKGFADTCHHRKEETLLFPALEASGFSRESGPVAVMLHEHTIGRSLIAAMTAALRELQEGSAAGAAGDFAKAGEGYSALLSEHIAKEDQVLFPMADMHLSAQTQAALAREFERVEREEIGEARHEQYRETLQSLKRIYCA